MIIGLTGKPSCGKSTFFKAATLAEVEIANYPFTTIKPNTAIGYVRVKDAAVEFGKVSNPREGYVLGETRFVPVQLIDVAGLVPGAHEGEGMGSQFLDDLNQADALIHVIDISGSTNAKGETVETGSYDPAEDIKFLEHELDMWYLRILKKGWEKFARRVHQEKQKPKVAISQQMSGVGVTEDIAGDAILKLELSEENVSAWSEDELMKLATELRKVTKPMIIAANKVDISSGKENFEKLKEKFPDLLIVPCSAESELGLREAAKHELIKYVPGEEDFSVIDDSKLNDKQKGALTFVKENILGKFGNTGVQQVLDKAVYDLLKYMAIFPGGVNKLEDSNGNVLPDCFLLKEGSNALDFAYRIHSDLGDNFIRAIDVRTKKAVGKDHVLKDRDVVEIVSGK